MEKRIVLEVEEVGIVLARASALAAVAKMARLPGLAAVAAMHASAVLVPWEWRICACSARASASRNGCSLRWLESFDEFGRGLKPTDPPEVPLA